MEITKEILKTIRDRAVQACIAKYNINPSRIIIDDDYSILCEHEYNVWGGGTDISWYFFNVEELSIDLDVLVNERKEREEQERIEAEIKRKEIEALNEERAKERRRQEYFKLKQEFE